MKSTRTTVTITLSEGAIDALRVLSMLDMRSKSQEIEYLIIDAVERRNITPQTTHTEPKTVNEMTVVTNTDNNILGNYYVGVLNDN